MILYIFWSLWLLFGLGLFIYSFILFRKNKQDVESLKVYGAFSYVGIAIFVSGLSSIIGEYVKSFQWVDTIVLLIVLELLAHWLLRPGFKKKKS